MAMIPIAKDTSFSDITVSFEVWILFGIFIIVNSKSAKDSALKCFVFFLISQPLVYIIQDVVNKSSLFVTYYIHWFIWTIATIPMGFIGWYMKKDKWWGFLILAPMLVFLGYQFCAITMILYPLVIFNNKKIKMAGILTGIIILIVFTFLTLQQPKGYDTEILTNGGSAGAIFDDSYKVYLVDESMGTVDIRFIEQGLNDWVVHALFSKTGNTEVILESPSGEKTVFDIKVDRNTYTINKK